MRFTVDRFENDIAVVELENGEMLNLPAVILEDAHEGDTIVLNVEKKSVDTHSIFETLRKRSKDIEI